jgi:hypothetical protein
MMSEVEEKCLTMSQSTQSARVAKGTHKNNFPFFCRSLKHLKGLSKVQHGFYFCMSPKLYNPQNLNKSQLIESYVVRQKLFEKLGGSLTIYVESQNCSRLSGNN